MGEKVEVDFEPNLRARVLARDRALNLRLVDELREYWRKLGHTIDFYIRFNEKLSIYEIRSNGFVNGLPREDLSDMVKRRVLI